MPSFRFRLRVRRRRRKYFCRSRQNRLCQTLHIWDKEYVGLVKCAGWPFCDLDPRSRLWHWLTKNACLHDKIRTTGQTTTELCSFEVPPPTLVMHITYFGEIMLETFRLIIFKNFGCVFFKVKHSFDHISGMVDPINVKGKTNASVGYWIYYVTLTFDLSYDPDLIVFKVIFRNRCISGIVGLIDVKWKGSELMKYWVDSMTLPFDHTHDLDLEIPRSEVETALSQELNGQLAWNERDMSRPFMTMILTFIWPWWGGWTYQIATGVTSNVSVPSTYLVKKGVNTKQRSCCRAMISLENI